METAGCKFPLFASISSTMRKALSSEPRSAARIMTQDNESKTPATALENKRSTVTPTPRKLSVEATTLWPQQSSTSLPALSSSLTQKLAQTQGLTFPINEECTSLKLTPSGRLLIAGFTDGTVRLFDLTGRYKQQQEMMNNKKKRHGAIVDSKFHQRYGAVACQIHAKGVHTSLRMDVDVAPDGLWCFAGVLRGSMELVAVHLGHLERVFDNPVSTETNLLDHLTVYRHGDAKLRGFGACTRLKTAKHPKYLLFTGKAIKNIHIWSFEPRPNKQKPIWTQLYDTQTNGNTIKLLQFRHNPEGHLQAISKSDGQKLRVWDLQHEEDSSVNKKRRPSRPPFEDVANTESTLGIAGGFCLCGGSELYNQMSIVSLDVDNLQSAFNHTELALPGATLVPSVRRRQQRGDLKCIQDIAGMTMDAGQALLELSDGSIVQYTQNEVGLPMLKIVQDFGVLDEGVVRKLCVGRIGSVGLAVAAVATYNPLTGKGSVHIQALDQVNESMTPRSGFWGFAGIPTLPDPIPTPKVEHPETVQKDDLHTIADNMHPVTTTAKKPTKSNQPVMLSTAKKSFAEARKSILTPQFAKDITVKLDSTGSKRKAEPAKAPKVSLDNFDAEKLTNSTKKIFPEQKAPSKYQKADTAKLSVSAKKISPEQNTPSKYLKTADGSRREAEAVGDQVKPEPAKENRVNNEAAQQLQIVVRTPTKERSPPVPRKRSLSEHINDMNNGHALVDVASTLCRLGTSPVPYRPELQPPSSALNRSRSPGPRKKKDTPESRAAIRKVCKEQEAKVKAMLEEIPKTTVSYRLGLQSDAVRNVADGHEMARRKMAAEHLASHEGMCKKVLRATLHRIQGIKMYPTEVAMDKARKSLEHDLRSCYEMTQEMIHRQEMEACALAAQQTFEQQGNQAPCLSVSFAFPYIFEQAMDCLPQLNT